MPRTRGPYPPEFKERMVELASDREVLRLTGRAVSARELADRYGLAAVDGRLPKGPSVAQRPGGRGGIDLIAAPPAGPSPPTGCFRAAAASRSTM